MLHGFEQWIIELLRALMQSLGWLGVVVAMAIESANVPLPSEVIMPLAGWMLIKEQNLPLYFVFIAGFWGAVGNTVGSLTNYALGIWGGRPFVERYGKWLLISKRDLHRAESWFDRWGDKIAFFSRLLPVVRTFVSFPAGVVRMHPIRFTVYTFMGSFIWCTFLAWLGYITGENWEVIRAYMRPFDIPILIALFVLLLLYIKHKWSEFREIDFNNSSYTPEGE